MQDEHSYHHEVDDPRDWDEDDYALHGPVEAHGHSLDLGLLLLRLAGLPMVLHGVDKAVDMPAFTRTVDANLIGGQAPDFIAWIIMLGQVALPILVAVGLFTRPAAFLLAAMAAAAWIVGVYLRVGYEPLGSSGELTGEPTLLYLGMALALVFTGAGRMSIDSLRTGGRP